MVKVVGAGEAELPDPHPTIAINASATVMVSRVSVPNVFELLILRSPSINEMGQALLVSDTCGLANGTTSVRATWLEAG
jgi:hypothetical protein